MTSAVLAATDRGLYCEAGDFYIDPWRPVGRALITHGHSDHARDGHGRYLATHAALPVIRHRLGDITAEGIAFGEARRIGGATVSYHPAGHVPGSAQIRVEVGGEVWVASGDYKVAADTLCEPFEPVRCHSFISECTFGLPVFKWRPEAEIAAEINAWWAANAAEGRFSAIGAYSLGKAQRVLMALDPSIGPILTHGAVENTNEVMRAQGLPLPATVRVTPDLDVRAQAGGIVVAPPSALGSTWVRRFGSGGTRAATGFASGWMQMRGVRRRRAADRGFVLSDHADWGGLNGAIAATGAERVFVTHGYTAIFGRWLATQGYDAQVLATEYEGESLDAPERDEADAGGAEGALPVAPGDGADDGADNGPGGGPEGVPGGGEAGGSRSPNEPPVADGPRVGRA